MLRQKYQLSIKILIIILTISSFLLLPFIGTIDITFSDIFSAQLNSEIFFNLRLSRVIFSFLTGFSLALIGAVFQALLRNDLATPYTLGISSGGALGAVIAIKTGIDFSWFGFSTVQIFSVASSICTIFIIYAVARTRAVISPLSLILAGVTISFFFSALIMFIHYISDFTETYRMIRWLMGGLQVVGWNYIFSLLPAVLIAFLYFYRHADSLNIMTAGRELAMSKGVEVLKLQKYAFLTGSVLIGVCVALAGPIGFIGLIFPHLFRMLFGPGHKTLLLFAPLAGGMFLIWADTIARIVISPAELPVGIITSLIGGPFFIWLLIRHKRNI